MNQKWGNSPSTPVASFASLLSSSTAAQRASFTAGVNASFISSLMQEYSRVPHIAGSAQNSIYLAQKTADYLREWGWDEIELMSMPCLLTNLTYRSVNVTDPGTGDVVYACSLEEANVVNESAWESALKPSLGYSGAGRVSGKVVWANYGREEDFKVLDDLRVDLNGTIVVVRYGEIFRGDKVKMAAVRGAIGVIIVNDPYDVAKGPVFPDGPWASNTSVQRGSIYNGEGDPLTPSWPSQLGGPTLALGDMTNPDLMEGNPLATIPVQPMGYGDAAHILQNLGVTPLPETWRNTGFLAGLGGFVGPGPQTVSMEVRRDLIVANITNVFATIRGSVEPDRTILFGSHRDAWTYGAGDPISGHSTQLETARNLGRLHRAGWTPRRSIQYCSWDAEEWAIIGSVEYVERNLELLRQRGVTYLNLDIAVEWAKDNCTINLAGSPLMKHVAEQAAADVTLPDGRPATAIFTFDDSAGSGSDHVAFIQLAGVPVLDGRISSPNSAYEAVYHSNYDSFFWYSSFADPGFLYHQVISRLYGNIAMRLADENVIELDVVQYAASIQQWTDKYATDVNNSFADFSFLQVSAHMFQAAAAVHAGRITTMLNAVTSTPATVNPYELRRVNDMSMGLERVFLGWGILETGLNWYKHVIFAPSAVDSYSATPMPLISNALATRNASMAKFAIGRVAQFVQRAAYYLNSSLVLPQGQ